MELKSIILDLLTGIILTAFSIYIQDSFKKKAIYVNDETIILKMNIIYRIMAFVYIFFTIIIAVLVTIGIIKHFFYFVLSVILILFFGLSGILLFIVSNIKVEIDEDKIKYFGMTGKTKELEWKKIKKVEWNRFHKRWILRSEDITINIDLQLIGILDFMEKMKEQVNESIYKDEYFKFKCRR
jgi:hypothetical protein